MLNKIGDYEVLEELGKGGFSMYFNFSFILQSQKSKEHLNRRFGGHQNYRKIFFV